MTPVAEAAAAINDGELIVYPTETVYALGGNALDPGAIGRVFKAKDRPSSNPIALAVATVDDAFSYTNPDPLTERFMREFLPGPVTVIAERRSVVPPELTGGRQRVGVRVPDCDLARSLLSQTPPLTATSANVSGREPVRRIEDLDGAIHHQASVVLDGGDTPGGSSTVVDVLKGRIHRRGLEATAIDEWLAEYGAVDR